MNELQTQQRLAADLGYLEEEAVRPLIADSVNVAMVINALIAKLAQG